MPECEDVYKENAREGLALLLHLLERRYPTRSAIAKGLGLGYGTVAHWYDGSAYPSFSASVAILKAIGAWEGIANG